MRCKACDKILEDTEATKKDKNGNFYDLCNNCYSISLDAEWDIEVVYDDYSDDSVVLNNYFYIE